MKKLNVIQTVTIINILIALMIGGITNNKWQLKSLRVYHPFLKAVSLFLIILSFIYILIILVQYIRNKKNPKLYQWSKKSTIVLCIWLLIQFSIVFVYAKSVADEITDLITYEIHETVTDNEIEYSIENYETYEKDTEQYITIYIHIKNNQEHDHYLQLYNWELETVKNKKRSFIHSEFIGENNSISQAVVLEHSESTESVSFKLEEEYDEIYLKCYDIFSASNNPHFKFIIKQ